MEAIGNTNVIPNTLLCTSWQHQPNELTKTHQLMESSDGKLIANAFLDVFRNVSRREAVERALANVCKMLGDPQLAKVSSEYFLPEINKTVTLSNIDAYKALTRLMVNAKNGWFVREKASFILGVLLSKSESLRNESFLSGEEEEDFGDDPEAGKREKIRKIRDKFGVTKEDIRGACATKWEQGQPIVVQVTRLGQFNKGPRVSARPKIKFRRAFK